MESKQGNAVLGFWMNYLEEFRRWDPVIAEELAWTPKISLLPHNFILIPTSKISLTADGLAFA